QSRAAGVEGGEARQGFVEVVLGGGAEAIAAAAHVDEANITSEDLALRLLPRSVLLPHRLLEPEREAHFFELPKQLVRGGGAPYGGTPPRGRQAAQEQPTA